MCLYKSNNTKGEIQERGKRMVPDSLVCRREISAVATCSYLRSPFLKAGNLSYGPIRSRHWVLWAQNARRPRLAVLAGPHLVPAELPFGAKAVCVVVYLGYSGAEVRLFPVLHASLWCRSFHCCMCDVATQGRRGEGIGHGRDRDSLLFYIGR
ncbi:uncharacterized protein DI49_3278 [Saccharomyces eubayanus]|uniref:uncharacterized protein n=1 Tax=Saccharomyces eubayanus TaxID=1080349 RepID=UPI0006C278DB|nr:hypothetical protein DI49_3278 [Saccharomyces eubayanus]KOG98228.1 hypothetical protein DI49_3278 [Saccharomyces eubayanus]